MNSNREAKTVGGRDRIITPQAQTVIIMPAWASVSEKDLAISVKRPMGINFDVLNTNAQHVSPNSGSHCLDVMPSRCIPVMSPRLPKHGFLTFKNPGD